MAKIAIMGFGTVGAGVAEVARMNASSIAEKMGEEVYVKYILDVRDFPDSPYADRMIKDFSIIENDPEVEVVVETIGGARVALDFTRRALKAGKHVVTSNKELVATYGRELLEIAKEKNVNYLFEASVGGGIPLLRPLFQCLAANEIEEIAGEKRATQAHHLQLPQRMEVDAGFLPTRRGKEERAHSDDDREQDHQDRELVGDQHDAEGRRPVAGQVDHRPVLENPPREREDGSKVEQT